MKKRDVGLGVGLLTLFALAILMIFPFVAREPPAEVPPLGEAMQGFVPARPPRPIPEAAMRTAEGASVRLADFAGKTVLLNFWATWCAPCVREMPTLDALQREMGGETFQVVALSSDRQGAAIVEPFLRQHGIEHLSPFLDPTGEISRAFGVRGLPTTVLIDPRGREVGRLEGVADWNSTDAKSLIRYYTRR